MSHKNQFITPENLLGLGNDLASRIKNPTVRTLAQSFGVPLLVDAISAKFGLSNDVPIQVETIDVECEVIEEPKLKSLGRSTTI